MGNERSRLRPEIVADLAETTDFTQGELNDLYRQYRHDCYQQGHGRKLIMKLDEFKAMYEEIFPDGDADKFAEHVFRTYDKGGNGEINFKEFITGLNIQLKGSYEQKLNWLFDLYDVENTNFISKEDSLEIVRVLHDLHSGFLPAEDRLSPEELANHIFKRADPNDVGKVDRQAFLSAAEQSKTLRALLEATAKVASQPFTVRKERSGSFGRKMVDYSGRPRSGSQLSGGSGSRRGSTDDGLSGRARANSKTGRDRANSTKDKSGRERANSGRTRANSARERADSYKAMIGPSEVMIGATEQEETVKL